MATKRAQREDPLLSIEASASDFDLLALMDDLGAGVATIDIHRISKDGRRPYVDRVTVDTLRENPFETIREKYGTGKFLIKFRDSGGTYVKATTIDIDPIHIGPNGQPAPASNTDSFIKEQMVMQQNLLLALIGAMKPPDMTPIVAAITGNRGPDPSAMLTAVVTAFSTLRGEAPKDGDWLEKAKTIIGLAKDLAPEGGKDSDDSWLGLLKEGVKTVVPMLPALAQQQPQPGGNPPPPPAPAQHIPPLAVQPAQVEGAEMMSAETAAQLITFGLQYLKKKAQAGKDVDFYVDQIMENLDEKQWEVIVYAIEKRGATFQDLIQFDPEIGDSPVLRPWFESLYKGLHDEIFDVPDSQREGGDKNNPPENERGSN